MLEHCNPITLKSHLPDNRAADLTSFSGQKQVNNILLYESKMTQKLCFLNSSKYVLTLIRYYKIELI